MSASKALKLLLLATTLFLNWTADAAQKRSQTVARAFQLENPCPATGQRKGRCPGYQRDHRIPLCYSRFGLDVVANIQWLTIEQHRAKTKLDIKVCDWDGRRG